MKELFDKSYEIKSLCGTFYMGIMLSYGVISFILGKYSVSINIIWQVFILAGLSTLYQYVFYGEYFFPKLNIKIKVFIHYIVFLITMIITNYLFSWFPMILVISVFTIYFLAVSLCFVVYNKISGEKFNKKLLNYKNKNS